MQPSPAPALPLIRHPDSPLDPVRSLCVRVRRIAGGLLELTYSIEGELERLRVPAPSAPRRAERLWEHTCCEVFVAREGSSAYHELNFSPSGEWAAHAFTRYREGGPLADDALNPRVAVRASGGKLELDATVKLERLSASLTGAVVALAIAAVIEQADGTLTYWALRHPPGKPDFHHPDAFALELDAPR